MEENNSNNESQNNKKLFRKGGLPGPGRGKKKPPKPLTLLEIEGELQKDLRNSDPKIRHNATKIYLMLKKQMGESTNSATIDPNVRKALAGYTDDLFGDEDVQETDEDDITN